MCAQGIVVPPEQGPVSPGVSFSLKLRGEETGDSIMMFEETITGEYASPTSRQRRGGLRPERRGRLQDWR
jgi:hypothetical protein